MQLAVLYTNVTEKVATVDKFPNITLKAPFCSGYLEKADLARFLSKTIVQKGLHLRVGHELVMGDGFSDATEAK